MVSIQFIGQRREASRARSANTPSCELFVERGKTLLNSMFSGVYVALRRKELEMSPLQHTTGVKDKTDTYFGSSNVGFLLGSSRPSPAGLSSASVFGITSRVISTLPWKEIVAKACLSLFFETVCTHGFVYQCFIVHCEGWRHQREA